MTDLDEVPMVDGRPLYYRLVGHAAVPATRRESYEVWDAGIETRQVAKTFVGAQLVSTVFLSLDHSYGDGPPLIFETMVFGGEYDHWQWRYATWGEAEADHERIVSALTAGEEP